MIITGVSLLSKHFNAVVYTPNHTAGVLTLSPTPQVNLHGYLNPLSLSCKHPCVLRAQGVLLYLLGPRVSGADPQAGDDQRRGPHGPGAEPLLYLQPAYLCASLPLTPSSLELPQVRVPATQRRRWQRCSFVYNELIYKLYSAALYCFMRPVCLILLKQTINSQFLTQTILARNCSVAIDTNQSSSQVKKKVQT